jgi:hypothetical protein
MPDSISGKTAIVGVAESDQIGRVPDKPAIMLHAEAARSALAEAGLTKDDVDGLFTAGISTLELGEYLGIEPKVTDTTSVAPRSSSTSRTRPRRSRPGAARSRW